MTYLFYRNRHDFLRPLGQGPLGVLASNQTSPSQFRVVVVLVSIAEMETD
jgi:hypothetical protein